MWGTDFEAVGGGGGELAGEGGGDGGIGCDCCGRDWVVSVGWSVLLGYFLELGLHLIHSTFTKHLLILVFEKTMVIFFPLDYIAFLSI